MPLFYCVLSLGGALGTLAAAIISPLVFTTGVWEFPLSLALSCLAGIFLLCAWASFPLTRWLLRAVALVLAAGLFVHVALGQNGTSGHSVISRDFYGVAQVYTAPDFVQFLDAGVEHGSQLTGASSTLPTTYFTQKSGVGRAMTFEETLRGSEGTRAGIIGLGAGTLAAYCRPGDRYVFYEIDPQVIRIAQQNFSYLSRCAGVQVREGDGRLLLQQELAAGSDRYDILVMDAFNGDTVPVHLLTREAFSLYAAHLRGSQSIIAVNLTNEYLDLAPVAARLAQNAGFSYRIIEDDGHAGADGQPSMWAVLAKDPAVLEATTFSDATTSTPMTGPLWSDEYTSLFGVFRF